MRAPRGAVLFAFHAARVSAVSVDRLCVTPRMGRPTVLLAGERWSSGELLAVARDRPWWTQAAGGPAWIERLNRKMEARRWSIMWAVMTCFLATGLLFWVFAPAAVGGVLGGAVGLSIGQFLVARRMEAEQRGLKHDR